MVYPALLPPMRTPRLPVVDWTDAPADLNGLVRFAERRNLVSARVPSHFKRSLYDVVSGEGGRVLAFARNVEIRSSTDAYHKNGIQSYTAAETPQLACHLFQLCWCNSFLLFLNAQDVFFLRVFSWTLFAAPISHITPQSAGNTIHLRLLVARISTTSYYIGSLCRTNLISWFNDQHLWYLSRT
jgi:hypothetical protein